MKLLAKTYSYIHEYTHDLLNINLPGLGFLLRQIKSDYTINFRGKKFYFNHQIADNYARVINGRFNEPETHVFIQKILNKNKNNSTTFLDIGANVGEFIIDFYDNKAINEIHAFEPQNTQFEVLERNRKMNKMSNVILNKLAVSNFIGHVTFNINENNTTASRITNKVTNGIEVPVTTLDDYLSKIMVKENLVLLIDTEGQELNIMKGGIQSIKKHKPIIIFEYNHVTKENFELREVKELLESYNVYRLNRKGKLDSNMFDIWNLVAIPQDQNLTFCFEN